MEGFRRIDEWHLIEREIDDLDAIFLRNEEALAQLGRDQLSRDELAILELVNGARQRARDDYDQGGQVVVATFANASVPMSGRFGTVANGYMLIQPAGQDQPNDTLATIVEPNSPLVTGLQSLKATAAYRSTGGPINGGVVVAKWGLGSALIVRGVVKGRNRADVNLYPPLFASRNDFWAGDGFNIMRNALLYR